MKTEYYEEAREYFVVNGWSMKNVERQMAGRVSRKTLYNWAKKNDWDEERKKYMNRGGSIRDKVLDITERYLDNMIDPSPSDIFALTKILAALKNAVSIAKMEEPPEEVKKTEGITEETIKKIEDKLGIKLS